MSQNVFAKLSDDVILSIFYKLEEDPRNWARIACVSTKFSSLIHAVCCKTKCSRSIPAVVSDLVHPAAPPGVWASLYKVAVCCPGLLHAGVLLENSDFGLEREIGPDENYQQNRLSPANNESEKEASSSNIDHEPAVFDSDCAWSLYDDLLFDTLYTEAEIPSTQPEPEVELVQPERPSTQPEVEMVQPEISISKKRKVNRPMRSHLASGVWNLSREQGNKLLASRFKGDCLYICDWPGCVHVEEKRNYMLFRGIFKNFKQSRVWRTINDGSSRSRTDLNCAFCASKQTWDLHSSFCLRRYFGFHDDGEPVVRAYVCENGHVSGAWTDWPLYT